MLKSLKIKNVALISEAEIVFGDKLNVLSGETGAGKSVVLECLNFVLGQKADKTMIKSGEPSCSVTCVFDVADDKLVAAALEELGIEPDPEVIVRRVMTTEGKSSIKLNGESVNASMLRAVTSLLVDVHGQSDHFILLKESNQLELIDSLGGENISAVKEEAEKIIGNIKEIKRSMSELGGNAVDRERKIDYLKYCVEEIENAAFYEGEDEELQIRKKKLVNSEKIISAISAATELISGDGKALDMISEAEKNVSSLMRFDDGYERISDRMTNVIDELNDINAVLNDSFDADFDPKMLDVIEERLDVINSLKSKYGKDYAAVYEKCEAMKAELEFLTDGAANLEKLEKQYEKETTDLHEKFGKLSDIRKAVAKDVSLKITAKLAELGMKSARFGVDFETVYGGLSALGNDKVTFMFSANLGEVEKPLSKVISGGELSRLMLAIKAVTGPAANKATFIFDEIDAGVSGNAAQTVAENFAKIAVNRQIIAISHLPQIVAISDTSLLIEKREAGGGTVTTITNLDDDSKVTEILRLIGGFTSVSGMAHAKEMIVRANAFKASLNKT